MRTKSFLLAAASAATMTLSPSLAVAAPPNVVVVSVTPGPLDAERIRVAVGRELAAVAVGPDDPRAASATGRLTVEARTSDRSLTVTFRKSDTAVTRTVPLPDEPTRAESSAVLLAGNVARDEAGELLRGMRKAKPADTSAAPAAPSSPSPSSPPPSSPLPSSRPLSPPPPAPGQIAALAALDEGVAAYERLDGADEVMVRRYAIAVAYARMYNVKSAPVTKALARLAYYTDLLGDAKMSAYVTSELDPHDRNGVAKLPYTPQMYVQTRPGLAPPPAAP